jgi:2-oxoglutarate/2-oxoacid ferredoxin oxidoreductase subunit alpha
MMREFVDGAEMIARGAIDIGCSFFAGYPITPASSILHHMLRELPKVGGVGLQAEDEIASISLCIGASMTGAKALTATSGPGLSLYSENIGLAIMGEVPLVIVVVMRLGPATGGATTVAQGDVQFARWGTSGGYPIIALCPSSAAECYTLTQRAFNLAEQYRSPVFLLTDKEIVMTQATLDTDTLRPNAAVSRLQAGAAAAFLPYFEPQADGIPAFAPVGDAQHLTRFTTSTHDERGLITRKPDKVARLNQHLSAKIEAHTADLEMVWADRQPEARTLLIAYGVTSRAMQQAVRHVRSAGGKVSQLVVHSLWPVPELALRCALSGHERVVVAELNAGQYRQEVERVANALTPRPLVVGLNRLDGELITPEQIEGFIDERDV